MVVICFHPDRLSFVPTGLRRLCLQLTFQKHKKSLRNSSVRFLMAMISFMEAVRLANHHTVGSSRAQLAPKHSVFFYLLHEVQLSEKEQIVYTMHFQTSNNIWSAERSSFTFCLQYNQQMLDNIYREYFSNSTSKRYKGRTVSFP